MSKGIRQAVNAKFMELAAKRIAGEFGDISTPLSTGNTEFRRAVMQYAQDKFQISIPSAATAYNHARIKCSESNPELVAGLGRPEDKKGGRKKGVPATEHAAEAAVNVEVLYNVFKVKNNEIVKEGLTEQQAVEYIAENGHPNLFKPKLDYVAA